MTGEEKVLYNDGLIHDAVGYLISREQEGDR
jgi:hypothetical protein